MEIYDPGQSPRKHRKGNGENGQEQRVFFHRSALNDWTPLWEKLTFFTMGFIGLQVLSFLTSGIIAVSGLAETDYATAVSLNNFLAYLLLLIAFVLFLFLDKRKTWKRVIEDFTDPKSYAYAQSALAGVYLVNILFSLMYSGIPYYGSNDNQETITQSVGSNPVLMFFSVAIFAPICEELTYRIGLVDSIGHKKRWLGVLLSSLIFGAIHFDFSSCLAYFAMGEESGIDRVVILNELLNLPVYVSSGLVLGFAYALSGRISSSIVGHAANNTLSFVLLLAL